MYKIRLVLAHLFLWLAKWVAPKGRTDGLMIWKMTRHILANW